MALITFATACHTNVTPAEVETQQRLRLLIDNVQDANAYLEQIVYHNNDSLSADLIANHYYINGGEWLWINANNATRLAIADSLANFLKQKAREIGFSPNAFLIDSIHNALAHFQNLDFDSTGINVSQTMANLELNLTKAYLRYAIGQRYGFMSPHKALNHLDPRNG
ncbi:MAG: hypothetical protein K2O54_03795, partial [Prevotella sp.]|nr:hypothetical protein [Prevotella sp.]